MGQLQKFNTENEDLIRLSGRVSFRISGEKRTVMYIHTATNLSDSSSYNKFVLNVD